MRRFFQPQLRAPLSAEVSIVCFSTSAIRLRTKDKDRPVLPRGRVLSQRITEKDLRDAQTRGAVNKAAAGASSLKGISRQAGQGAPRGKRETFRARYDGNGTFGKADEPTGKGFLGGQRRQPMNPLLTLEFEGDEKVEEHRVAHARQRKGSRKALTEDMMLNLSKDQAVQILDSKAPTMWSGYIWRLVRYLGIDPFKVHEASNRASNWLLGGVMTLCALLGCCYWMEMNNYKLIPQEYRKDYRRIMLCKRGKDIAELAQKLQEENPNATMGDYSVLLVEAGRDRGWHELDPETALRNRPNPILEGDIYHIFYWTFMYFGHYCCLGGPDFWMGRNLYNPTRTQAV